VPALCPLGSLAGPDGISWKLLKAIKGTKLGKAVIEDVAQVVSGDGTRMPEEWRSMKMVMVPKPGKDHTKAKGWRRGRGPLLPSNCYRF